MLLIVVVHPREEFDRWVAAQQAPARDDPAARRGRELFASLACINCHTVRGTPANGVFGPDLTHLMTRWTIGAGAARNTHENLRAWVNDPAALKQGALMPAMKVSRADLDTLTDYLVTLSEGAMSVLSPAMPKPDEADAPRALVDHLHDWVVTVDHKRLGIMYVVVGPRLLRDRRPRGGHDAHPARVARASRGASARRSTGSSPCTARPWCSWSEFRSSSASATTWCR